MCIVSYTAQEHRLGEVNNDKENDIILVAVSGKIGLKPTIIAINNGIDISKIFANPTTIYDSSLVDVNYDEINITGKKRR